MKNANVTTHVIAAPQIQIAQSRFRGDSRSCGISPPLAHAVDRRATAPDRDGKIGLVCVNLKKANSAKFAGISEIGGFQRWH
jgi:hypothetical protein